MTLFQSNARRAALVGGLGCALIAHSGCSFDSRPRARETDMQPSATSAERDEHVVADAATMDSATDKPSATAMSMHAASDAGAAVSGSASAAAGSPATAPAAKDAGPAQKPELPPDDQGSKPAQDAGPADKPEAKPSEAMPPKPAADAGKTPEPEPNKPDAATSAAPMRCKPGVYTGTFSGMIQLIGVSFSSVNGTVRAQLKPNGQDRLDLLEGKVFGVDPDGNRLTVDLLGSVNCITDQLEDGRLENGVFHNVAGNSDTLFVGKAQAVYSTEPHSLVGTFTVEANDVALLGGKGTWSVISGQ